MRLSEARRVVGIAVGAAAWWMASCSDIPAPEDGILSVSPLLLPSPGLVAGDTMRDSTGVAAPLRLIAYALDGQPLDPQPTPTFIVLDTTAHLAGALLIGDDAGTIARVVGALGTLQTRPVEVKVTVSPDTLVASDSIVHRKTYALLAGDSVSNSPDLSVIVRHLGVDPKVVEAVIVNYTIDKSPPSRGQGPALVLLNGNVASDRDTTDASGKAARVARLRLLALSTFEVDTALVSATASYRGRTIGTVQFTIIYSNQR